MAQTSEHKEPGNTEVSLTGTHKASLPLRIAAHVFSYIFHPLFIPTYVLLFLLYLHPSYFSGVDPQTKLWLPFSFVQMTVAYPLLVVVLLKALGFIKSIMLHDQRDRIIPYIAAGIFYFWLYQVCKNYPSGLHPVIPTFTLGVFFAASVALIANIYFKVSMHATAMGGWLGIFLLIMLSNTMLMTWPLSAVLLITGTVCTSRLLISDHTPKDIYGGLLLGMVCQFAASIVVM